MDIHSSSSSNAVAQELLAQGWSVHQVRKYLIENTRQRDASNQHSKFWEHYTYHG